MPRKAIIPENFRAMAGALDLSLGILSGDHLFLTGTTGSGPDGCGSGGAAARGRGGGNPGDRICRETARMICHLALARKAA